MTTLNVVQMSAPRYEGVRDAEDAMTVVRNAIYGHDLVALANRIGVSRSCLYSIRAGRTKWPKHGTFFALIDALDLVMYLRPRNARLAS